MNVFFSLFYRNMLRRRRSGRFANARGQSMLLGLMCMVVLLVLIILVFDVQNFMRMKFKVRTASDAAALVGANWQRYSLNMIGDLNLVMASSLLLSEVPPQVGSGIYSKQDLANLNLAVRNVTEMQSRVMYAGPLIGFGAMQQAGKANGLNPQEGFAEVVEEHVKQLKGDLYAELDETLEEYTWRVDYINMVDAVYANGDGIAVGCNARTLGYPSLTSDREAIVFLTEKSVYDAILANYWCGLRHVLRGDFSGKWYGNIKDEGASEQFAQESEYLSLHLRNAAVGGTPPALVEPSLKKRGMERVDLFFDRYDPDSRLDYDKKYDVVSRLRFAVFDSEYWYSMDEATYNTWAGYMRGSVQERYRFVGANAYALCFNPAVTLSGKIKTSREASFGSTADDAALASARNRYSTKSYDDAEAAHTDETTLGFDMMTGSALAKTLGYIKWKSPNGEVEEIPPYGVSLVMPCFHQSVLIPVSMEPYDEIMFDYKWYCFLKEYLPTLGTVGSVSEMQASLLPVPAHWPWFAKYHAALLKLDNAEWRQAGIEWLDTPTANGTLEDTCDVGRTGGSHRGGPSKMH